MDSSVNSMYHAHKKMIPVFRNKLRFLGVQARWVSVASELSPNPEASIFWVDQGAEVLGKNAKSLTYMDKYSCGASPLAGALFKVCLTLFQSL